MPLKLYAISFVAARREDPSSEIQIGHSAACASAETEQEAAQMGLEKAREHLPAGDGWANHDSTATEITFEELWGALRAEVLRLGIVPGVQS